MSVARGKDLEEWRWKASPLHTLKSEIESGRLPCELVSMQVL